MSYYKIENLENYFKMYKKSVREPRKFWDKIADENFTWYQKWDKVFDFDMQESKFEWFQNAKLNITKNCIDRHLAKRGEKTAIIFEPNDPKEEAQHISYNELYARVAKLANVLRDQGVKKGDRVCIYLPMIPELAVAVLACARIGAVHSVVLQDFQHRLWLLESMIANVKWLLHLMEVTVEIKQLTLKELLTKHLKKLHV